MTEELKMVLEAFSNLGATGVNAFIIWVAVGYLKTLTTTVAWVLVFAFIVRRIGAGLFAVAKAKANV